MLLSVLKTTIGKVFFLTSQIVKWGDLPDSHFLGFRMGQYRDDDHRQDAPHFITRHTQMKTCDFHFCMAKYKLYSITNFI